MAVTVAFVARPIPLPALPPPLRLEGEVLLHGTTNGLVVASNPAIGLTGADGQSVDGADSLGADTPEPAGNADTDTDDALDSDSADSPDG